jgi:hypothetical protein
MTDQTKKEKRQMNLIVQIRGDDGAYRDVMTPDGKPLMVSSLRKLADQMEAQNIEPLTDSTYRLVSVYRDNLVASQKTIFD